MRKICAWCKKELAPREEMGLEREITHGICSVCALKFSRDVPKTVQAVLDLINEPVLVIDSLGIVNIANESGLKFLGKERDALVDHLAGDALECSYARLVEGCGRTEHCRTCAIRNVLMETLASGKCYHKVPAYQKISTSIGDRIMRFYVSTEKFGDQILLRIDDVEDIAAA